MILPHLEKKIQWEKNETIANVEKQKTKKKIQRKESLSNIGRGRKWCP